MRTLVEALATCTRAIFLHHTDRGYGITDIEGSYYDQVAWHPTLLAACEEFFGEVIDTTGVAFHSAPAWHPEIESAEWWPRAHRGSFAPSHTDWLRPFASCGGLPEGAVVDGAPKPAPSLEGARSPGPGERADGTTEA